MLSICVTVKNRSRLRVAEHELLLFPNFVASVAQTAKSTNLPCELVVADWESNDWALTEWIHHAARPVPLKIVTVQGPFSAGRGRNIAAANAAGDAIFFVDADCIVCPELLLSGLEHLHHGKAFFPIQFSYRDPQHQKGWWRHEGFGNVMLTRETFLSSGGWPDYSSWGKEDNHFFERVSAMSPIARHKVPGFLHQWHPDDFHWKNQYGAAPTPETAALADALANRQRYFEKLDLLLDSIETTIPPDSDFILIDDTHLANADFGQRTPRPFLEKAGQYWGAPADDAIAILELERMRHEGTPFLVIASVSFWWLDHYTKFHDFLRTHFHRPVKNPQVIIYDLRKPPEK